MNIKKFFYLMLVMTVTGCGYHPLYTVNNEINFSINQIFQNGNENINRKIVNRINSAVEKNVSYNLLIDSKEITEILTKNALGNADLRKLSIEVQIKLSDPANKDLIIKEKIFNSQFIYKNEQNKFDLAQSIKIKKDVLIDKIIEDILIFFRF
tara:strand:- start:16 stop:474 length:459 start_codon:yes stop_codon:yes gene_type:complete